MRAYQFYLRVIDEIDDEISKYYGFDVHCKIYMYI